MVYKGECVCVCEAVGQNGQACNAVESFIKITIAYWKVMVIFLFPSKNVIFIILVLYMLVNIKPIICMAYVKLTSINIHIIYVDGWKINYSLIL